MQRSTSPPGSLDGSTYRSLLRVGCILLALQGGFPLLVCLIATAAGGSLGSAWFAGTSHPVQLGPGAELFIVLVPAGALTAAALIVMVSGYSAGRAGMIGAWTGVASGLYLCGIGLVVISEAWLAAPVARVTVPLALVTALPFLLPGGAATAIAGLMLLTFRSRRLAEARGDAVTRGPQ